MVSDEWMKNHQGYGMPYSSLNIYLQCDNPDEIQKLLKMRQLFVKYNLGNLKQEYEQRHSTIVLFFYIFIWIYYCYITCWHYEYI